MHERRAQHDPVGVGLDRLEDGEHHGRDAEDQGHPAQRRGAAYGDDGGEDQHHLHDAEDGTAGRRGVEERIGEHDEQLPEQQYAGRVGTQCP